MFWPYEDEVITAMTSGDKHRSRGESTCLYYPTDCLWPALGTVERARNLLLPEPSSPLALGAVSSQSLGHGVSSLRRRAPFPRMYFTLADELSNPLLTSNQPRENPPPFLPSGSPPPAPAPSNADIEAVIQMATSNQGRMPIPKDTRTQLFVGNVRSLPRPPWSTNGNHSCRIGFAGKISRIFFARPEPSSGQMSPWDQTIDREATAPFSSPQPKMLQEPLRCFTATTGRRELSKSDPTGSP